MVTRQLPRPAELLELMQFKRPELNGRKRRLDSTLTIADLRMITKRRTPRATFDYTDGAAEGEISLDRARRTFEDVEFHPDVPRPAPHVDTSSVISVYRLVRQGSVGNDGFVAAGHSGNNRAIAVLRSEAARTMTLRGVHTTQELEPRHAPQLTRLGSAPTPSDA